MSLFNTYPTLTRTFFRKTIKFPVFSFLSTLHLISPFFAPKVLRKDKYDILISLGTTSSLTTQAIYRTLKIPYIAVIHDPIVYILKKVYAKTILRFLFPLLYPLARYFERSIVSDAKKTIIISKVHYNYIKNNYGVTPVIHTFGTEAIKSIPKKRGSQLLSFGRWQNEKNPYFLLKLLKKIPDTHLTIAGTWIDQKELNAFSTFIKEEKLQKRVSLVPAYDKKKLRALCNEARLFLHPHFEAFGLAALEAAGHGLPIIIPKFSGVTDIFKHGVDGFFPSHVDVTEYTAYIQKLLNDEREAYKMGAHAWKTVKEKLSWEANTRQLLSLILEVVHIKPKIFVVEISHVHGTSIAGGDKLMEPMAMHLADNYTFSIIVSGVGAKHWQHSPLQKKITALNHNIFDHSRKPVQILIAYCIRMFQTYNILKHKISPASTQNVKSILYSSTDVLPDVLPAFFIKKRYPNTHWIARVHHLIAPPNKRRGNIFVNLISYLMQSLSLTMMRTQADLTLALNANLHNDLQKKGFKKERLKVLGGGIELEKIEKVKQDKANSFNAVFLGRLHVTKGIFDTIPIWKEVTKKLPLSKLAIIGDGSEYLKKSLRLKIKEESLSKNISLLGFLPYEKVYSIMKQADIFLFLDHEAGWGLAVAEAMACGLPIIGYDNGVLGSVYKNGYLLAPLGDHQSFSRQIIKLLQNKAIQQKLSIEARNEAAKHDWELTSKKFSNILKNDIL